MSAALKVRPEPLQRGLANTQLMFQFPQEDGVVHRIEGGGQVQKNENHRLLRVECTQKVTGDTIKSPLCVVARAVGRLNRLVQTVPDPSHVLLKA